ncbi:MAG: transcriptional regulator [Desulfurococcaceae archaeon]
MSRDQLIGWLLFAASLAVVIIYVWLMWFANEELSKIVVKLTLTIAVVAVLGILAWIGYTLATTPPPKPIEEIEKEIEEELKKLEQEEKQQKQPETEKKEK